MIELRSIYEKGFFHLLSANFLHQFLGFGILLIVAKFLTPVELGEIRILQSYTAVFTVFAVFGSSTAVLKICSENRPMHEREGILLLAIRRSAVTTLLSFGVLALFAGTGILTPSPHLGLWLIVYALLMPFSVGTELLMAFLQALKKIKKMATTHAIIKLQAFIVIIVCTYVWGFRGFIFASITAYVIGFIPLLRATGTSFLSAQRIPAPAGFFALAWFSVLSNGIGMIGKFGDIFILDHFSVDRSGIGYYALASLFMYGAIQVTATVQSISTPYLSERARELEWFRSKVKSTQIQMAFLSLGVAAGLLGVAYVLIHFFYGIEYLATLSFLPILLVKYVIWSCYAVMGVALLGLGYMKYNLIVVSVVTPVGILASYILLQSHGIHGVAWGQVIAGCIGFFLTLYLYMKAVRIRS
jgi:O-antigen/teichoic acid export membrane protein